MSGQTYGFQQMLQRTQQNTPRESGPCPSCHQPSGNAAAIEAMRPEQDATGWLDGVDLDENLGTGAYGTFGHVKVDTGMQESGKRLGTAASASLWEYESEPNDRDQFQASIGKASGEVTGGTDGVTIGGGLSLLEVALDGTKRGDPNGVDPMLGRFGLGAGAGAGIRVHHSDKDNDGRPECGTGFDLGVVSADLISEALCPEAMVESLGAWWNEE